MDDVKKNQRTMGFYTRRKKSERKRNVNLNVIGISEYVGIGNYRDAYQFSLGDSTSNVTITLFFVLGA